VTPLRPLRGTPLRYGKLAPLRSRDPKNICFISTSCGDSGVARSFSRLPSDSPAMPRLRAKARRNWPRHGLVEAIPVEPRVARGCCGDIFAPCAALVVRGDRPHGEKVTPQRLDFRLAAETKPARTAAEGLRTLAKMRNGRGTRRESADFARKFSKSQNSRQRIIWISFPLGFEFVPCGFGIASAALESLQVVRLPQSCASRLAILSIK